MKQVINKKMYNTETAEEVASDKYWDGHNWDRRGRNKTLYKTKKGRFFMFYETRWQEELDNIEAISPGEAMVLYEELPEHEMSYEEAFNVDLEQA